jgi:hypothetical protein
MAKSPFAALTRLPGTVPAKDKQNLASALSVQLLTAFTGELPLLSIMPIWLVVSSVPALPSDFQKAISLSWVNSGCANSTRLTMSKIC